MKTARLNGIAWFLNDEGLTAAVRGLMEERGLYETCLPGEM